DGLVGHTRDGWRGGVNYRHFLAAVGSVATGFGGPTCVEFIRGLFRSTGQVGHRAENGDGHSAAGVAGGRWIEGPGAGALDGLVGHRRDGWRGGVNYRHFLAAVGGVSTGIGRPPGARGIEGVPAVTAKVGDGAEDGDGYVATGVAGGGRVKGPSAGALNGFVGHTGDGRRGVIFQRYLVRK